MKKQSQGGKVRVALDKIYPLDHAKDAQTAKKSRHGGIVLKAA
jgi:hypothetical protein